MICPHCNQEIPDEGFACPKCGKALPRDRTTMSGARPAPPTVTPVTASRRPYALAGVLAAIVLVLGIVLFMALRKPVTQANTALPPPPGPPVTAAPTPAAPLPGPPVTEAPRAQPPKLAPEDPNKKAVEAYLQKVSYIEKERQRVVNDLTVALFAMELLKAGVGNPVPESMNWVWGDDPSVEAAAKEKSKTETPDQAQQAIGSYVGKLKALDDQLKATTPIPAPAMPFAQSYNSAFYEYAGAMIQIGQIMQQAKADPGQAQALAGQLSGMKGSLGSRKDRALAAADQQLTVLCQKYGIQKPFDVTDTPAGGVTGM
ncbi:MAG TPA: zinc ribbon domain-containing protein [Armatimonadota bacterium]|jgi:hypothetical protein